MSMILSFINNGTEVDIDTTFLKKTLVQSGHIESAKLPV